MLAIVIMTERKLVLDIYAQHEKKDTPMACLCMLSLLVGVAIER